MIILNKQGTPIETYLNHARQNQLVQKHIKGKKLFDQPICPKCERVGFRDKGWMEGKMTMVCSHCGYKGPTTKILRAYLEEGLYK